MLTMQSFFTTTALGLSLSSRSATAGALAKRRGKLSLLGARTIPLPPGVVGEGFASPPLQDREDLLTSLRQVVRERAWERVRHAGLSLPDPLFRIQMIDFDELPSGDGDRERLIRWRVEKAAVFDMAGTVLQYQVAPREDRGYAVLACFVRREVLSQYIDLLDELGLDPWNVRPASFHVLNLYAPTIAARNIGSYALVWIAEGSSSTLIIERGVVRFYRYRDLRAGAPGDVPGRLARELDDTLHFYLHMDRNQRSELSHVFLAGDPLLTEGLASSLGDMTELPVERVTPAAIDPGFDVEGSVLDTVIGAGGWL